MPELLLVSVIMTSTSKSKSPYSVSVQRKLLGELGTEMPAITPLYISNWAFPPCFFQPSNDFPSNRVVQPNWASTVVMKNNINEGRKNLFILQGMSGTKSGSKLNIERDSDLSIYIFPNAESENFTLF